MNAWGKNEGGGKKIESFTKGLQNPIETFTNFVQRLTLEVKGMISNLEATQIIIETVTFENVNVKCKMIIMLLNSISEPLKG